MREPAPTSSFETSPHNHPMVIVSIYELIEKADEQGVFRSECGTGSLPMLRVKTKGCWKPASSKV